MSMKSPIQGLLLAVLVIGASAHAALGQTPRTAQEFNYRGLDRQNKGDIDGAIDDFTKAIERSEGIVQVVGYINRANARSNKSDWDGAIADYTRGLELQLNPGENVKAKPERRNREAGVSVSSGVTLAPPIEFTYNNRGNARRAKGDVLGAIADYTKALEQNPKYADAFYNRGVALQSREDFDAAIRDYSNALGLAPKFAEAYVNRGQAKQSKEDFDGAIADYDAALQLKPDEGTYFARASARESKKDLRGALADYSKVLELNPNSAQSYVNRAAIEAIQGEIEEAERDFERGFGLDPGLRAQYKEFIEKRHLKIRP